MGSYISLFSHAFQQAIHELIVSVLDLIIYFSLILLTLLVGKGIGLAVRSVFGCAGRAASRPVLPSTVSTAKARFL
ncbi:E protein [Kafue kinda chacma baboon virus]|uniref:E protein n=1 Tax=Kafue kinda chacma baboon virus TaxID=1823757 RepID=A0A0Y0DFZ4_9NIDO|nr:E protein [Kafue kinda chacma baboon virus]AMB20714.1 E protein [Kafue kinda chacma baboon virus]AMV49337.1 E protein [Kafue kinda chacma baboon virus]